MSARSAKIRNATVRRSASWSRWPTSSRSNIRSSSDLKIDLLVERIRRGGVGEVILAISTSVEGETTLFYLMNRLREFPDLKITSIARGIGFGDELEYVDELTLTHALLNRRAVE